MTGTLYLIPNTLGLAEASSGESCDPLLSVIPTEVQSITAQLNYFIAENAKTTRAFLKLINAAHPLAHALQTIEIAELNIN
ncbi:MAG: SAM-dependent methyltransferase, partial [Glaciimonas sp.]|nr:SAM-dependent methyltransferase [Glaciimonas sp.]